jgi:hypothetical protein
MPAVKVPPAPAVGVAGIGIWRNGCPNQEIGQAARISGRQVDQRRQSG